MLRKAAGGVVLLAGLAISVACGGSSGQASPSATTPAPVITASVPPSLAPLSTPSPKPEAAKDACALISASDMQAAFGPLKAGTTPTLEPGTVVPPGALSVSICTYRFPGGDISVVLGRFQDTATASAGLHALIAMAQAQSSGGTFRPLSALGDEATIYTITLSSPIPGQGAGIFVRGGAVAFALSGGFAQGSGPADLGQAFEAVARKVAATI